MSMRTTTACRVMVLTAALTLLSVEPPKVHAQAGTIDQFFDEFSADWMRRLPSEATRSRYFTGAEQQRLDRQLTPETAEQRRETAEHAR
jgi:hypothetical protein